MNAPSLAVALLLLAGCSGETEGPSGDSPCDGSSTAPMTYVVGLEARGGTGALGFTLEDALPAPPGRGTNRWEIQVRTSTGEPATGASIAKLRPWMPDHGHGSVTKPTTTMSPEGLATIDSLELVMPGVWMVTVAAEHEGVKDEATFAFCIDG